MSEKRLHLAPEHLEIVQEILRRHVPGMEVWAFGSRTTGNARPYSDLDLALIADQPLPLSVSAALADAFADSPLPFKVDLVDWATTTDAFRRLIQADRIVVHPGRPPSPSFRKN